MGTGTKDPTGGLKPSSAATRLHVEKGQLTVTDGPFTEAKEVVGGWAILKVSSRAEALENSKKFMELPLRAFPAAWLPNCRSVEQPLGDDGKRDDDEESL
jgi:hypothetical protein